MGERGRGELGDDGDGVKCVLLTGCGGWRRLKAYFGRFWGIIYLAKPFYLFGDVQVYIKCSISPLLVCRERCFTQIVIMLSAVTRYDTI